jgi:hypothetical protein
MSSPLSIFNALNYRSQDIKNRLAEFNEGKLRSYQSGFAPVTDFRLLSFLAQHFSFGGSIRNAKLPPTIGDWDVRFSANHDTVEGEYPGAEIENEYDAVLANALLSSMRTGSLLIFGNW